MNWNDVVSLDNYSTGHRANHIEGVEYICGDTADVLDLSKLSQTLCFTLESIPE